MGFGGSIGYGSPYYLHLSDYPKQLHINEELTDNNYGDWSQEVANFLFAKNKIQFVDGTLKKPEKTCPDYMSWIRSDTMIKDWLTTAMGKNIRASVKYANISFEIWSDLLERFGKESAPRAYELKYQIAATRQYETSVSTYYTMLRFLWDESQSVQPVPNCSCAGCSCGLNKKFVEYQEKEKLYEFLMGLDPNFALIRLMGLDPNFVVIRTQILETKPTPTLGTTYHMVAEDERQRIISTDKRQTIETAAFKAFFIRDGTSTQAKKKGAVKTGKEIRKEIWRIFVKILQSKASTKN